MVGQILRGHHTALRTARGSDLFGERAAIEAFALCFGDVPQRARLRRVTKQFPREGARPRP